MVILVIEVESCIKAKLVIFVAMVITEVEVIALIKIEVEKVKGVVKEK